MKKRLSKEYVSRVKKVIRSKLNGGNMVNAINRWLVSLLRYSGGMVKWTKIELTKLDRKTRKLLTIHEANASRLYLSRKKGGRGLISMEICVKPLKQNVSKMPAECRTHSMWEITKRGTTHWPGLFIVKFMISHLVVSGTNIAL